MEFRRVLWLHVYFFHEIALCLLYRSTFALPLFTGKSQLVNNRETEGGSSPSEIHIQTVLITRHPLPVYRFH